MENPKKLLYFVVASVATFILLIVGFLTATRSFKESPALPSETPVTKQAATAVGNGCKIGGCNAEICQNDEDENAISTCEYHPKYACYQRATCEKQADGNCGWTENPELLLCLDSQVSL